MTAAPPVTAAEVISAVLDAIARRLHPEPKPDDDGTPLAPVTRLPR